MKKYIVPLALAVILITASWMFSSFLALTLGGFNSNGPVFTEQSYLEITKEGNIALYKAVGISVLVGLIAFLIIHFSQRNLNNHLAIFVGVTCCLIIVYGGIEAMEYIMKSKYFTPNINIENLLPNQSLQLIRRLDAAPLG